MWQPIETAPKDGTRVLLFSYASTWGGGQDKSKPIIRCGRCDSFTSERLVPVVGSDLFRKESYEGFNWVDDETYLTDARLLSPSHWMPLPEPPK